jgi:hypothetical protein
MFAHNNIYFRLHLLLIIIYITCISLSLRRTSVPIHLTSVLGVLGTQETSCIVIVGLLERDTFDLFLTVFDKPWVIHLRETCCCSTNLCTWRPNTIYKNRIVRRHHAPEHIIVSSQLHREKMREVIGLTQGVGMVFVEASLIWCNTRGRWWRRYVHHGRWRVCCRRRRIRLMHVKCIHDLCTLPLDILPYLHHMFVIFMLFDDYWE